MFLRRTTESLEFISVHGGVTLVSVTGAIGSARDGKKFFVELIKSINAAKAARPQPPQTIPSRRDARAPSIARVGRAVGSPVRNQQVQNPVLALSRHASGEPLHIDLRAQR